MSTNCNQSCNKCLTNECNSDELVVAAKVVVDVVVASDVADDLCRDVAFQVMDLDLMIR